MHTDNILLIKKGDVIEQRPLSLSESFCPSVITPLECFLIVFKGDVNVHVDLKEEGAFCSIKTLYLASKTNKINLNIQVNHLASKTKSSQIIKGIATDKSKVFFNGNIYIDNKAQKSDGFQNHRSVLLSDDALVQAVPALEIYADDVKCAHGSATGPLDKNALFYLLSRGITEKMAKKMLLESFIFDMVPNEGLAITQQWIENHV